MMQQSVVMKRVIGFTAALILVGSSNVFASANDSVTSLLEDHILLVTPTATEQFERVSSLAAEELQHRLRVKLKDVKIAQLAIQEMLDSTPVYSEDLTSIDRAVTLNDTAHDMAE